MTSYWRMTNHTAVLHGPPTLTEDTAEVPGCARTALLGYFPEIFLTTAAQQADTRKELADFAAREGYVLRSIVFERLGTEPAAFERLVELARRDKVTTVVIPHSDDLDAGQRQRLAVEAGAHVVVARARRPRTTGLAAPPCRRMTGERTEAAGTPLLNSVTAR